MTTAEYKRVDRLVRSAHRTKSDLSYHKLQLRLELAEHIPNCSACVTYAYILEGVNTFTNESRRINNIEDLKALEDLRISCVIQIITELS